MNLDRNRSRRPWGIFLASLIVMTLALGAIPAAAQEGMVEDCEIDEFDFTERDGRLLIEGTATCSQARMEFVLFDDDTGRQIAEDFVYIMDGEFSAQLNAPVPDAILIEYTID